MAKAPKKTDQTEEPAADVVPAPLAAAVEAADPVMQAHITRQANHFNELAPSLAKQTREDEERELELAEQQKIAGAWEEHVAAQRKEQAEREERENAAAAIEALIAEIPTLEETLGAKKAELDRLQKLVKE